MLFSTILLQVLSQARQHIPIPANAVADVLAMAVHKGARHNSGMAAATSDLLVMWQQLFPADWAKRLTSEAASMLAVMLHQDGRCSEAAGIFESRMEAGKVCPLVAFVFALAPGVCYKRAAHCLVQPQNWDISTCDVYLGLPSPCPAHPPPM